VKAKPCDVRDVIASAMLQIRESTHSREIVVRVACDLPLVTMHVLMVEVPVNFLDNALEYSEGNMPVEIRARLNPDQPNIRILDRGKGIPEGELERVFDKSYRVCRPDDARRNRP